MADAQTVRGPIGAADLGVTLMHEHIFVLSADVQQNYPSEWGSESARLDQAVEQLQRAYDAGVRTVVDLTVTGLGRHIPRIQAVAERTAVNLVVATGIYTYRDLPFYFHHRGPALSDALGTRADEPMVGMFVGDITTGIAETGVKAGMLKCAIDEPGLTSDVERVFRAVAQAHLATGAPITVHTHPGSRSGLQVHRVMCEEEGVDPGRIVLAHSGDTSDEEHLVELADLGFVLGMDRFGVHPGSSFEGRADTLISMVNRGYAGQMVLSQDAACYIDWMDPRVLEHMPQWHYAHVLEDVVPYVLARGLSRADVDTMLVDVPRSVLAGS